MSGMIRGLCSVHRSSLLLQINHSSGPLPPILVRGKGYRFPISSGFSPLRPNQPAITAQNIVEHCQKFFSKPETVPKVVVFGGGYSEPLDSLPTVISAMEELRLSRHGLPFVVQTNGRPSDPTKTVEEIIEVDTRFRDAPGSDGDSKLSVWVNIAAHSPPAYKTAMEEDTNGGFGEVCGFISSLVEGGARVYATGVVRPGVNVKAVEQVAEGMGCGGVFWRSYHPRTLYEVLGVEEGEVNEDVIKESYKALAREFHPDLNDGNVLAMEQINEAKEVLLDKELRDLYDVHLCADLAGNRNESDLYESVVIKSI